ncbi:MAG: AzlC family ABC transporter permease [Bacillota bacterium]
MSLFSKDFKEGVKDIAPILVGIIPFGMIAGIAAINAGLSKISALAMSVFLFAGAAQLAVIQLIADNSAVVVIIGTALVINLRFVMYSASLAPYFKDIPPRMKFTLSYLLTDQPYALSISRFAKDNKVNPIKYYLGNGIVLWVVWQLSTLVGIFVGYGIPKEWGLDFAIPLTFMVLLFKAMEDSATVTAAVIGGLAALVARPLPYNLGLIIAALIGVAAGLAVEIRKNK